MNRTPQEGLPTPRGPLSTTVLHHLTHPEDPHPTPDTTTTDPYGEDLHLALYTCYELHYRGFPGVDPTLEWNPALLDLRARLEHRFLTALRTDAPTHKTLSDALEDLLVEPVDTPGTDAATGAETGVSHYLRDKGELHHIREYAAHRSLYHLKEADPHAWVLPRLWGRAKAAMAAVEFDEYGGGRPDRVHAQLFADLMTDLNLDTTYGHYLDATSGEMLANVNLMSLFGLHRALRGALVGHFATVEITSSPGSRRLAEAMRRTGAGAAAEFFYDEHVEADAVHEQVVRHDVIGGLLEQEPELEDDITFGIDATEFLEARFGRGLLTAWESGRSSLRTPLPASR
ncbi:iron-containing redox enzyme family protein [Streptomyces sp. NBC_00670]|uniref:iron-containing redox enzyme family protein n=1 Tax=Streptomyces sp. NBC_00670 TaxID=2975804 RepID=UPI002E367A00|nr:iron-containing redox enzyme family protein [Streptomyces sp. NBC_00670]